jgi:hypothetical protein
MSVEDKPVVERLDVDNYATWSIRMRALLISKGLWTAVTEDSGAATGIRRRSHRSSFTGRTTIS